MLPSIHIFQHITDFIRLTPLQLEPKHKKWVRDENDLREALEVVCDHIKNTERMLGAPMYAGDKTFDVAEDTKRMFESVYLSSREEKDVIFQRKRNLIMFHHVVEPIIDDLAQYSHQDIIQHIDHYIAEIISAMENSAVDVSLEDALSMYETIRGRIKEREETRKASIRKRKTVKRVANEPEEIAEEVDEVFE